ncbi:MAG: ATP-binding protein [Nocardioidaceae bacterium]|nr:ATP-binding protein [Nocardioidaceae bacterium]
MRVGRSGGLAGGAGYSHQDRFAALQLARMLTRSSGSGPSPVRVEWEAAVAGGSSSSFDVIVHLGDGTTRYVEVKSGARGAWTLRRLLREGVLAGFWQAWVDLGRDDAGDPGASRVELVLCSTQPAPDLVEIADAARRLRPDSLTAGGLTPAMVTVADALGIAEAGAPDLAERLRSVRFLEFLSSLDHEALPSVRELDERIHGETRWWGQALTSALVPLVADGRHPEPGRTSGLDRVELCERLAVPDGDRLAAPAADAGMLVAAAGLVVERGLEVDELAVTPAGALVADVVRLAGTADLSWGSADAVTVRTHWAAWAGAALGPSFESDLARWRTRLDGSPWSVSGFLLGQLAELVQHDRGWVVEQIEPWLLWLQSGLLDGEDAPASFVGREAFEAELVAALTEGRERFLVVSAGAGNGKTAFLRHLGRGRRWPLLLGRLTGDPVDLQRLLAASAATAGVPDALAPGHVSGPPSLAVPLLLERLARAHAEDDPFVLLLDDVDALATGEPIQSLFVPDRLPPGVRVVCSTSRPSSICAQLGVAAPLALDEAEENADDLEAFVRSRLDRAGVSVGDRELEVFLSRIRAESATWLYAKLVLDDVVRDGWEALASLPAGLGAYYSRWWAQWQAKVGLDYWTRVGVPALSVLLAAREPLRFAEIEELSGTTPGTADLLASQEWALWFGVHDGRVSWRAETHRSVIGSGPAPFGSALAEAVRVAEGRLADRSLAFVADGGDAWWARYGLRHAVGHLLSLGDLARVRELVVTGAQEWIAAHASVDSGSTYVADLRQVFDAGAGAGVPDVAELGAILRIRAQLGDNVDGTSVALLAPAVFAGLLDSAQLAIMVETDADSAHASWVRLLRFCGPDASDADLDSAVQALEWRAEFFGVVLAFAPERVVRRLVARWWADADGGVVPSGSVVYAGGREPRREMMRGDIGSVLKIWPVLDPEWSVQVRVLLDAIHAHLGPERASRAAHVLLAYLPWPELHDAQVLEIVGRHLPPERIAEERADRARMVATFETGWRARKDLIELVTRARRLRRSDHTPEELQDLREAAERLARTAEALGLHSEVWALTRFVRELLDGDQDVFGDAESVLESWDIQEDAGEMWPYPGNREDTRSDLLTLFLGGVEESTRREVAASVVRAARNGAPSTASFTETDDWVGRSRNLSHVLDEVEDRDAVIELVLRSASEETSTQIRRAVLAPFAGRFSGPSLVEAVRISVTSAVPTDGDLAALELISRGPGAAEQVLSWQNISAATRVRAWLAQDVPAAEKLLMVATWLPDDLGRADFESIRRKLDKVMDPGGFHREITAGVSGMMELGVLGTVTSIGTVARECGADEVERAVRQAMAGGRLRVAHEILSAGTSDDEGAESLWADLAVAFVDDDRFGDVLSHAQRLLDRWGTIPVPFEEAVHRAASRERLGETAPDPGRTLFWLTMSSASTGESDWDAVAARRLDDMRGWPRSWDHDLVAAALVWHLRTARPVPAWLWREASGSGNEEHNWNRGPYLALEPWLESPEVAAQVRQCVGSGLDTLLETQASLLALALVQTQLLSWPDLLAAASLTEDERARAARELSAARSPSWDSDAMSGFAATWLHEQVADLMHDRRSVSEYLDGVPFLLWLGMAIKSFGAEPVVDALGLFLVPTVVEEAVMRAAVALDFVAGTPESEAADDARAAEVPHAPVLGALRPEDVEEAWQEASSGVPFLLQSDNVLLEACKQHDPAVWLRPSRLASILTRG